MPELYDHVITLTDWEANGLAFDAITAGYTVEDGEGNVIYGDLDAYLSAMVYAMAVEALSTWRDKTFNIVKEYLQSHPATLTPLIPTINDSTALQDRGGYKVIWGQGSL
jgi:hypothetical protein